MDIEVPVSLGELLDKISILDIKESKIMESKKRKLIRNENTLLRNFLKKIIRSSLDSSTKITMKEINIYLNKLKKINKILWNIEDKLRKHERDKVFDNNFIELARSVYLNNDKRAKTKLEINNKFGSQIVEVKSYEEY